MIISDRSQYIMYI